MNPLLWPGDKVASLAGLEEGSDNRQILRMWTNTVVWGTICAVILVFALT